MDAYKNFASVYDTFMDETPYDIWRERIVHAMETYGVSKRGKADSLLDSEKNLIVDLGCGTGTLTQLLAQDGYDMIGIDCSEEMLAIANTKKEESNEEIFYLLQDMRELELYSTVGTIFSVCDSLNYLLEEADLKETFLRVNNYLYPGGIFVFDFNTVYKYSQVIGDTTIAENREDCSFIWDNYYHSEEEINEYDLTLFVKNEDGLYRKFSETHYQRGYTMETMKEIIEEAGMEWIMAIDGETGENITPVTERIFAVAKEVQKKVE